jgi:hypothetical protein
VTAFRQGDNAAPPEALLIFVFWGDNLLRRSDPSAVPGSNTSPRRGEVAPQARVRGSGLSGKIVTPHPISAFGGDRPLPPGEVGASLRAVPAREMSEGYWP